MRRNFQEDTEWLEYLDSFSNEYDDRVYDNASTGRIMKAGHIACESTFGTNVHFDSVLEIGAGTGEHFHSVKHSFDKYVMTDSDKSTLEIAQNRIGDSDSRGNIYYQEMNATKLAFEDNYFDRVVATHILEHLYEPHLAIKEWKRVLKPGGTLSVLIPTDPGIAWKVGRHLSTRRKAINHGWNYDYIMAREHVNPCNNLIAFLKYYLPNNNYHFWPFKIVPLIDCNLFFIFNAKKEIT